MSRKKNKPTGCDADTPGKLSRALDMLMHFHLCHHRPNGAPAVISVFPEGRGSGVVIVVSRPDIQAELLAAARAIIARESGAADSLLIH